MGNVKKTLLSLFVFAASIGYVISQHTGVDFVKTPAVVLNIPSQQPTQTQTTTVIPGKTPAPSTAPPINKSTTPPTKTTPTPTQKTQGQYLDGSYTGSAANAYYGTVQVRVGVQGRKLASVDFLQYPNDRRTSQYINDQAMPLLKQEAIQAQSASVSGVSGATYTSKAFRQSLTDALSQAKNI
ncbi:MAG: FMN-binding protein [Candidatus Magasanikbacteria bacterium CG_4_9_14_0_2_um_filter_41_10]|uniref:FMN-binding protein n=1 Tax=Candidatus Magasanikbacteria bacterium CG_4_10_14_0_2_um_filter_41_31 TaxID=1974639 RepID=A0A2M7V3G3_9BACT|nr:MAG: hypothetical protein AUJ37_04205 [Candidatus Magasanikbacteria bacterium CG1_02_41_34]PIZ93019.1 MAG: FMN-binding protein [Candidatus Magasanikbacteria bacterium CG_4_10_14_0_2_um_filter_41_31]PJC53354.1 MAG: FMN-binding protein [Candidatus Magasanikbacteria bacterium CG_4_9_14_0_2_um_filter_41_10]